MSDILANEVASRVIAATVNACDETALGHMLAARILLSAHESDPEIKALRGADYDYAKNMLVGAARWSIDRAIRWAAPATADAVGVPRW